MPVVLALVLLLCAVPSAAQTVVYPVEFIYTTVKEYPTLMATEPQREAADRVEDLNRNLGAASYGNKIAFTRSRTVVHHLSTLSVADIIGTANYCATFRSRMNNAAQALTPFVSTNPKTIRVYVWPANAGSGCYPTASVGGTVINTPVWTSFVHEVGHILGWPHARALVRNGTSLVTREYGDVFDGMGGGSWNGYGRLFQPKPSSKLQLGWFDATHRLDTVTTSQTVTLIPYETQDPGLKAIRIRRTEYVQVFGRPNPTAVHHDLFINYMAGAQTNPGVPLRSGVQLDLDLGPGERWTLPIGVPHREPLGTGNVTLTLISQTPTEAVVLIDFEGTTPVPPATPPTPSVSVGPALPPTPIVTAVPQ